MLETVDERESVESIETCHMSCQCPVHEVSTLSLLDLVSAELN